VKYLIAGLGNIGPEYHHTRHNIGFMVLDALCEASDTVFKSRRYGDVAEYRYKGRTLILLKPSTFMNLSGNAVRYWLHKEKIQDDRLLVILDDLALPPGQIRLRPKGGDGGHNGLKHIIQILGHQNFARLRIGIGKAESVADQSIHVLSKWNDQEIKQLPPCLELAHEVIRSFVTTGVTRTMNQYNGTRC